MGFTWPQRAVHGGDRYWAEDLEPYWAPHRGGRSGLGLTAMTGPFP